MSLLVLFLQLGASLSSAFLSGKRQDLAILGTQLAGLGAQIAFENGQPITQDDLDRYRLDAAERASALGGPSAAPAP